MEPITLSNGDIVELRDPKFIRERDRRALKLAYFTIDQTTYDTLKGADEVEARAVKMAPADIEYLDKLNDHGIVALIKTWKRGDVNVVPGFEALQDLDMTSYGELSEAAAPLIEQIQLDFSPTPEGQESPTEPADA